MTPETFRLLIEGSLAAWRAAAVPRFRPGRTECEIDCGARGRVELRFEHSPAGPVWHLAAPGRRARAHPSILPALRGLRASVAPDRPGGRVLFVAADGP